MIGVGQLVLIFAIVLVLFGAGKIPSIMKDLGIGMRAFKKGLEGIEDVELDNKNKRKANSKIKVARKVKKKEL